MKAFQSSKVSMLEKIFNHICKLAYSNLTGNPWVARLYNFFVFPGGLQHLLVETYFQDMALPGKKNILNLVPFFLGPAVTEMHEVKLPTVVSLVSGE